MTKRMIALALGVLMLMVLIAACGDGGGTTTDTPPPADTTAPAQPDDPGGTPVEPPDIGEREYYEFEWYYYYDWQSIDGWGNDIISKHWSDMFNIHVIETKPDANAQEALNLRIAAEDYPDAIWMDRDHNRRNMGSMGLLVPIDEMKAAVDNNWYDENIAASTQALYASQTDGVNYLIPNWARYAAEVGVRGTITGGNEVWMYTTNVYEAVGSPVPETLDDLYDYAVAVRDANLTNAGGAPIIPVLFDGNDNFGADFMKRAMYLSFGGEYWTERWYTIVDDTIDLALKNPAYREAVLEVNKWFREGLIPATNFTDSREEFLAKLNNGRGGLIMYDFSQDDGNNFRRILRESDPGNSIEIFTFPTGNEVLVYPPKEDIGLNAADVHHIAYGSEGWNGTSIFRKADHPERIFELFTWALTPLGSIESMFGPPGPKGEVAMWEELDADGFPILHTSDVELGAEAYGNVLGGWRWTGRHGHANNVDRAKFAANAALPADQQNWVVTNQASILSPTMMMTDEFSAIGDSIDPTEDLHVRRTMINDNMEVALPSIIMASSREAAEQLIDDAIAFAEANGLAEISARYTAKWQENCAMQGGSVFGPPWPPAR